MSIFDLLFLLMVFASLVMLAAAALLAVRGKFKHSLRTLSGLGICLAVYLATGLAVSFLKPQRVIAVGDAWCFDDWCLTVETVRQTPASSQVAYDVGLRISSRARGVAQRANGAWIYLIDKQGQRYSPDPDLSQVPLDIRLRPGESIVTSRTFQIPAGVQELGLITGHGGHYCGPMDILIIGQSGCLFQKPTMIRIQ
jgi:hypothetical protein